MTPLETTLIDRIRHLSIAQQRQVLQFIDRSISSSGERFPSANPQLELSPVERRKKLAAIMRRLAARGGIMRGVDVLAWQREQRQDRSLPGRTE